MRADPATGDVVASGDCIFCRIVAGSIPAHVVYQDDAVISFLDVGPLAEAHILLVPRRHASSLTDMTPDECRDLFAPAPRLGRALLKVTRKSGFNLLVNNGTVAGQAVPHVHVHLVPRAEGDGLGYRWNAGKLSADRAAELLSSFKDALDKS